MTNELSPYEIQANEFLTATKTEFSAVYVRTDKYFDDDKEKRDIYSITLNRGNRTYTFTFGQSLLKSNNISRLRTKPTAYDVLACLTKYEVGTFEEFCSEFGYDTDSRKAEKTYLAVKDEWLNISRLYNDEELEQLREIN